MYLYGIAGARWSVILTVVLTVTSVALIASFASVALWFDSKIILTGSYLFAALHTVSTLTLIRFALPQFHIINICFLKKDLFLFSKLAIVAGLGSVTFFLSSLVITNEMTRNYFFGASHLSLFFILLYPYTKLLTYSREVIRWRKPVLQIWKGILSECTDINQNVRTSIQKLIEQESDFTLIAKGANFRFGSPEESSTSYDKYCALPNISVSGFYPSFAFRRPIWPASEFSFSEYIFSHFPEMQNELLSLYEQNVTCVEEYPFHGDPLWRSIPLYKGGCRIEPFASKVPWTMKLVENLVPGATIREVILSSLEPGGHIESHFDYVFPMLTLHIPVYCETGDKAGIRVGNQLVNWRVGEPTIIDTTFQHESWNFGDKRRLNLMMDFWPNDLNADLKRFYSGVYARQMARHL